MYDLLPLILSPPCDFDFFVVDVYCKLLIWFTVARMDVGCSIFSVADMVQFVE